MADVSRHHMDIKTHPDIAEMRERYARMLTGQRSVMTDGLVTLAGLYLAISPWVAHLRTLSTEITTNNLIIGLAVAALGLCLAVVPDRMAGMGWTLTIIGAWTIVAPWAVNTPSSRSHEIIWSNSFVGGATLLLGFATMAALRSVKHAATDG